MSTDSRARSALGRLRAGLRSKFFRTIRHIAAIDDTRDILAEVLAQQNASFACRNTPDLDNFESPYARPDNDLVVSLSTARDVPDPIFITARFRTGSTLLWNLFRNIPGTTSYYEPFNERRWFDQSTRGSRVDSTHLGVEEYWSEYRNLGELAQYYSEDWIRRHLYMPASSWNPAMERYIELMIERAPGRAVLQFNRVDLRLPWLRARFPRARILHLYRNPRDQWCSSLPKMQQDMRELTIGAFQSLDGYYLLSWGRDLRHCFPLLTLDASAHPYELFYQVWKLSYAFGRKYAHLSIAYENLVRDPQDTIRQITSDLLLADADPAALAQQVVSGKQGKGRSLADDAWYQNIERRVDDQFRRYFGRESRVEDTVAERLRAM